MTRGAGFVRRSGSLPKLWARSRSEAQEPVTAVAPARIMPSETRKKETERSNTFSMAKIFNMGFSFLSSGLSPPVRKECPIWTVLR